jgi:hypothetical protein
MTSIVTCSETSVFSKNEAVTGARKSVLDYPGLYHLDTRVFLRSEYRLLKAGHIICNAVVNVGHLQPLRTPANEDAKTPSVKHDRRDTVTPPHENWD